MINSSLGQVIKRFHSMLLGNFPKIYKTRIDGLIHPEKIPVKYEYYKIWENPENWFIHGFSVKLSAPVLTSRHQVKFPEFKAIELQNKNNELPLYNFTSFSYKLDMCHGTECTSKSMSEDVPIPIRWKWMVWSSVREECGSRKTTSSESGFVIERQTFNGEFF